MSKLLTEVGRILDLDPAMYYSVIISEADNKEKLRNTYMYVNGELKYVRGFIWGDNLVEVYNTKQDNTELIAVESLEPWLPLSGMYVSDKFAVHLTKKAHKHWRKSFVFENYKLDFLTLLSGAVEKSLLTTLATMQPSRMALVKNNVYLEGKSIGKIGKDGIVNCTNYLFYQELLDYSNKKELNWLIN